MTPNLYALLGVGAGASIAQIKTAFRRAAMRCHPDKFPDDPKAAAHFKDISFAHEVLIDPERRAEYDRTGSAPIKGADNANVAVMTRLASVLDLAMMETDKRGQVYTAVDMIGMMKEILRLAAEERLRMRAAGNKVMAGYRRMLGRFKRKGAGNNVMESLIKGKLLEGENQLNRLADLDKVDIEVGVFLGAYGYRVDLMLPDPQMTFGPATVVNTGWNVFGRKM